MLSIIIVNWNTGALLAGCLRSLTALPESERALIKKIVVVDNASTDDSLSQAEAAATNLPIDFLKLDENKGFAAANNEALAYLAKGEVTHALLLNPDTEVLSGALMALHEELQRRPEAGVVGPKLLNTDRSLQPSVRRFPTRLILWLFILKLNRLFSGASFWKHYMAADFDYHKAQTVDQVMGAAMFIRDALLQKGNRRFVGYLDTAMQWWFDDVDYCKRTRDRGWEIWYTPRAQIIHHGGASFNKLSSWPRMLRFNRSALRYAQKHV